MIAQLSGKMVEITPSQLVIDCGGVGYLVQISLTTYGKIERKENLTIYTYHIVREDAQLLYGFAEKQERLIFEKLISVNGVGPASAIMMLSTLSANEICTAIASDDAKTLQSVKGIGAKTAQRIIIDLKDKLNNLEGLADLKVSTEGIANNKIKIEALSALEVLGINKKQADRFVTKLLADNPTISLEDVIKQTLKKI